MKPWSKIPVTMPSAHNTNRMTKIVHRMSRVLDQEFAGFTI